MGVMEKISEAIKDLPEPLALEVLDFAQFLKTKSGAQGVMSSLRDHPQGSQPLSELAGGLKQANLFTGNPVDIQRKLRNQWQ